MNIKKKIYYSIDLGLFLSGIFLILLSANGKSTVEIRGIIGVIVISASYVLFPFIDSQKKINLFKHSQYTSSCLWSRFLLHIAF